MDTRLFRYLFENTSNAVVMTGCTWDKEVQEQIRYAYSCEMSHNNWHINRRNGIKQILCDQGPIDLLVLGAFSIEDAERLVYVLHRSRLDTVILPYVSPIQRFSIVQTILMRGYEDPEVIEFLKSPYLYLKNSPVKNFYFIYGNSRKFENINRELLYPGYHLESQDQDILDLIEEMEGYRIPVKKAGYIINNRMLFYLGYFGIDLRMFKRFFNQYTQNKQIHTFSEREIHKMLLFFKKDFGDPGMDTLILFCSPIEIIASQTDCVLNLIVVDKEEFCHADIEGDEGRCTLKCMLYNDSDVCRCHRTENAELRAGMLLLGNIRLTRHVTELKMHYRCVENQIRAITLPNCGHINNWSHKLAEMNVGKNVIFWLCPLQAQTSDRVLREIKMENARYRIVGLSEDYGCCFNGFLTEKTQ